MRKINDLISGITNTKDVRNNIFFVFVVAFMCIGFIVTLIFTL